MDWLLPYPGEQCGQFDDEILWVVVYLNTRQPMTYAKDLPLPHWPQLCYCILSSSIQDDALSFTLDLDKQPLEPV
jgi:hypothetical protein